MTPQRIDELTTNARRSLGQLTATLEYSNALPAERCRSNYRVKEARNRIASGYYDRPHVIAATVHEMVKRGDVWQTAEPTGDVTALPPSPAPDTLVTRIAAVMEEEQPPHDPKTWGEPNKATPDTHTVPAPGAKEEEQHEPERWDGLE